MPSRNTSDDERQTERAARAHHREPGRAIELALERNGDLLLDFLGGEARRLGDDLRGSVGDIRVGFDRQLGPANSHRRSRR